MIDTTPVGLLWRAWGSMLIALALAALAAFMATRTYYQREIARMERDAAQQTAQTERAARERLLAAQQRGDALTERLATTEAALSQKTLEADRALKPYLTGRTCLDVGAVRVLNGIASAGAVPKAAGIAVAADAAAAAAANAQHAEAATDIATDYDVAEWSRTAIAHYESCRGRLDALIDFVLPEEQKQ